VIYVDTLQRSIVGVDPNDFKPMSLVMENVERLGRELKELSRILGDGVDQAAW
jgi:hypothetical protein